MFVITNLTHLRDLQKKVFFVPLASHKTPERWVSGLNQQFAKLSYGKLYRGFESPLLRQDFEKPR